METNDIGALIALGCVAVYLIGLHFISKKQHKSTDKQKHA